jgi:hypothetical protein
MKSLHYDLRLRTVEKVDRLFKGVPFRTASIAVNRIMYVVYIDLLHSLP